MTSFVKQPLSNVHFYVVPHADDWQLFIQPNAYFDLIDPNSRVIFVIVTAGEAEKEDIYWRAREKGCISSIRFCLASLGALSESEGEKHINGKNIYTFAINDSICYFLRLPDGGLNGNGFSAYNYQSLSKLQSGSISSICGVDNSATYKSWQDLSMTLRTIIKEESRQHQNIFINYLSPDVIANPRDHPDHIATGDALQQLNFKERVSHSGFIGYSVKDSKEDLSGIELFWKIGMFAAYCKAVFDMCGYSTLQEGRGIYEEWCKKAGKCVSANVTQGIDLK